MKLEGLKGQKLTKSQIFRKSTYFGENVEKFLQNMFFLPPKMILQCFFMILQKPHVWKISSSSSMV